MRYILKISFLKNNRGYARVPYFSIAQSTTFIIFT